MGELYTFIYGLAIGFSLIVAIGAQNAFVLKQGLCKQNVLIVVLICAVSDSILISLGIFGFSNVVKNQPFLIALTKYLGFAFLMVYGFKSIYSAFNNYHHLKPSTNSNSTLFQTVLICLAFTWLNPHVYLDTVILMGSISAQFETNKLFFAVGAITSSWIFFFSLGFGARLLEPFFANKKSWKILDFFIGLTMLILALNLIIK